MLITIQESILKSEGDLLSIKSEQARLSDELTDNRHREEYLMHPSALNTNIYED